ncbi:MAG: Ig-like domain-containing protein [Cyclobacteriaceae bacterium]|nr:Ig-like domain-containing protein [Cyclobacteriaceae bacterium]
MKRLFLQVIVPILLIGGWSQCANIQSPSGGPKDKTPPHLLSSIPVNNQTGYRGTTVLLTFDEAVKLNSPREEIIISPSPGKEIEYKVKNNKVFITPKIPWKDSTTYSILFREGIQDITESNSPPNLKLAFSTGPTIDSLVVSGQVSDLQLGIPKDKITVAIYAEDTFDIFTHAPNYFTKTDKRGFFQLENLRAGRYWIYAFDDKNKNLKVESRSEMFGYRIMPIALATNIDTLDIPLIRLDTRPLKITSIRNTGNITRIKFNKGVVDYSLTVDKELTSAFGENISEISVWNPESADSLKVILTARDSLDESVDSTFFIKKTDTKPLSEKFSVTLGGSSIIPESGKFSTILTFTKPVRGLLLDSLFLKVDTTARLTFSKEEMTYRPKQKQYVLSKDLGKKMFGPESDPSIVLMLKRAFAISVDGDTSKAVSETVKIFWPEENGIVTIQANTKRKNYILQLLEKSGNRIVAQVINNNKLVAKNIPPGDYQVRAIIDSNANGVWDPGNLKKKTEPEAIIYYKAANGSAQFPVRANWEVGPLVFSF